MKVGDRVTWDGVIDDNKFVVRHIHGEWAWVATRDCTQGHLVNMKYLKPYRPPVTAGCRVLLSKTCGPLAGLTAKVHAVDEDYAAVRVEASCRRAWLYVGAMEVIE